MIGESRYKLYALVFTLGLALIFGYLIFWYSDIGDTLDNGVMLVESVVKGEFFDYYEYAANNAHNKTMYSANYNVLLYAVFAIWNLPVAIIHMATGLDYMNNVSAMLWCKGIIVLSYVGIFLVLMKLTERLGGSKRSGIMSGILSISSVCMLIPALVASQYDCIALFFMILGILFYSEGKTVKFLIMFAIAIPLKLFAVFILLPILLIRYKNVLKMLAMLAVTFVPSVILELPFKGDPYFAAAMDSQNGDALELLLGANVSIGTLKLNLFIIAYIVICFFCYMAKENDNAAEGRLAVYFSFAVFSAFCVLVPIRSYWIVLFTPFMAVLASITGRNRTVAILADTLAGIGGGLFVLANHWIYNTGYIATRLALKGFTLPEGTEQKYGDFKGLLEAFGIEDFVYVFFAVFVGSLIFGLWYLYPAKESDEAASDSEPSMFPAMMLRHASVLAVVALLLFCQFATQPAVKFGSDSRLAASEVKLMSTSSVSRSISFEEDASLSELTLWFKPTSVHRYARSFVEVVIIDGSTDKVIWKDSIGIAVIENDKDVTFDLDGLNVTAGQTYTVKVYGTSTRLSRGGNVSPYIDKNGELAMLFR